MRAQGKSTAGSGAAAVTVRQGNLVLRVHSMHDLEATLQALNSISTSEAAKEALSGALVELSRDTQRHISDGLGVHCSSLRDALFRLKKARPVSSSLGKRLCQLNATASLLRHYDEAWAKRLCSDVALALGSQLQGDPEEAYLASPGVPCHSESSSLLRSSDVACLPTLEAAVAMPRAGGHVASYVPVLTLPCLTAQTCPPVNWCSEDLNSSLSFVQQCCPPVLVLPSPPLPQPHRQLPAALRQQLPPPPHHPAQRTPLFVCQLSESLFTPPTPLHDREAGAEGRAAAAVAAGRASVTAASASPTERLRGNRMVVQVQTKLLVPARVAGAIIGKQCSMLKLIRESSGAQLEVLPQAHAPLWPNDRVVILKGNLAGRKAALEMVLRVAFQSEEQQTVAFKLLISSHMAGGVIGRQGGNLKAMRERCNVGVQMGRYDYAGERLVTANGPLHSIVNAAMMVLDHAE